MSGPVAQWLIRQVIPRRARPAPLAPPGLSTFEREVGGRRCRLHLRVDPDGTGLLVCNASAALHLQPTGVVMAVGLLEGRESEQVAVAVEAAFRGADPARVRSDVAAVADAIDALAVGPAGRYPLRDLDGAASDLSLQRHLLSAPPDRLVPALDRLWHAGVPFVTLHDRADADPGWLVAGVERAEDLGMIAAVRALGSRLSVDGLLGRLLHAGVDAVTVPWTGPDADVHDQWHGAGDRAAAREALTRVVAVECCAIAELAVIVDTMLSLEETLDTALDLGVGTFSVFAVGGEDVGGLSSVAIDAAAAQVKRRAEVGTAMLIWQQPLVARDAAALAAAVQAGPLSASPVLEES